jgi:hypothetical protein
MKQTDQSIIRHFPFKVFVNQFEYNSIGVGLPQTGTGREYA